MVEEKLKKSLFNTLNKTPILIGSISSLFSGENSFKEVGKTGSKSTRNLGEKQCPNPQIYRLSKTNRWGLSDLSVDRPVDRQWSRIRPLEPPVDRPVDRKEQRALLSVPVDWVCRPAICQVKACTSVHVGRPSRSTEPVDRLQPQSTWSID